MTQYIRMLDLCKNYGENEALKNVNLDLERGEFLTIVGPSGAGKTTLLRLLDMLDRPSKGHIQFDGIDVTRISEGERLNLRRRIGMVFQNGMLFNCSVFDNVAYPLRIRDVKNGITQRVSEALAWVGLDGFEERNATTLSGGEVQRVSIAQAVIFTPELLLLDEPTANLDPKNVKMIEEIIGRIAKKNGATILMSTHNMRQARSLSSRVAILNEGEIAEIGKPDEMLGSFMGLF